MSPRHLVLPPKGTLLINTDLHGNGEDFDRMTKIFEAEDDDTYWIILGDIVHAPDEAARARRPDLYDYDDRSGEIATKILALQRKYPERVHFVIGNHDWAHVGGPIVGKFWEDEAAHLESTLDDRAIADLHQLFCGALLCVVAPCGAFLSHASPGALFELSELDDIEIGGEMDERQRRLVIELTNFYGQREAVSRSFLEHVSRQTELEIRFVVHGHDRDEEGYFTQEDTQVCPVIFGAPPQNRRYLRLELSARYDSVDDLREGHEVLRLWEHA